MYNKFKLYLSDDTFFYGTLIVLVALLSFGLGRWSVLYEGVQPALLPKEDGQKASVIDEIGPYRQGKVGSTTKAVPSPQTTVVSGETQYVGSKNSDKYHLVTCPGASQIKEENKVYFASKEEAQKAGYSPASNCKGI